MEGGVPLVRRRRRGRNGYQIDRESRYAQNSMHAEGRGGTDGLTKHTPGKGGTRRKKKLELNLLPACKWIDPPSIDRPPRSMPRRIACPLTLDLLSSGRARVNLAHIWMALALRCEESSCNFEKQYGGKVAR